MMYMSIYMIYIHRICHPVLVLINHLIRGMHVLLY